MAEKLRLRSNGNGDVYLYIEDSSGASFAAGGDIANSVFAMNIVSTQDVEPDGSTAQITFDPSVNGRITFRPRGTGSSFFATGDVNINAGNLLIPQTNAAFTHGVIKRGSSPLIHFQSSDFTNAFVGEDAGSNQADRDCTGIGNLALASLVSGANQNTAVGSRAGTAISTNGSQNTLMGYNAGSSITNKIRNVVVGSNAYANGSGNRNVLLGSLSGSSYTGTENNNILIGDGVTGTLGDVSILRIGQSSGSGNSMISKAFIQGIHGVTPGGASQQLLVIDSNGQFGSTSGGSFTINTINADSGSAAPAAGAITLAGDGTNISTSGAGSTITTTLASTVTISGDFISTAGSVYVGSATPANPYDISIESSVSGLAGESIQNTSSNAAAGVNLQLIAEPAAADAFVLYNINGATTWSAGIDNSDSDMFKITTGSTPSGGTEAVAIDTSANVEVVSGNLTITAGDVTVSAGNAALPDTAATLASGVITFGATNHIHNYGVSNFFLGENAGNGTLTTGSAQGNFALGSNALDALTTGGGNNAIGFLAGSDVSSSIRNDLMGFHAGRQISTGNGENVCIGFQSGDQITTGEHNTFIGSNSGGSATGASSSNVYIKNVGAVESNTIRIGTQGAGAGQQNVAYMAGIYGVTPGATINVALVDSNGQLGSVASLGVANGGTGAATLTDHGMLVGSGTSAITALAVGTDGQIPIAATGADPAFATVTSSGGTITVSGGANTLNLDLSTLPAFLAYNSADDTNQTGNGATPTVDFDTEVFDQGGDFAADTFTAPVTGIYRLEASVSMSNFTIATQAYIQLVTTARTYYGTQLNPTATKDSSGNVQLHVAVLADMTAMDTAHVVVVASGEAGDTNTINGSASPHETYFSGSLVR